MRIACFCLLQRLSKQSAHHKVPRGLHPVRTAARASLFRLLHLSEMKIKEKPSQCFACNGRASLYRKALPHLRVFGSRSNRRPRITLLATPSLGDEIKRKNPPTTLRAMEGLFCTVRPCVYCGFSVPGATAARASLSSS